MFVYYIKAYLILSNIYILYFHVEIKAYFPYLGYFSIAQPRLKKVFDWDCIFLIMRFKI